MIQLIQDLPKLNFMSTVPDLEFKTTESSAQVEFYLLEPNGRERLIFSERFSKNWQGVIKIREIADLLEPEIQRSLLTNFRYKIGDTSNLVGDFSILYAEVEINIPAEQFAAQFFLRKAIGPKPLLPQSAEYLHFVALEPTSVLAKLSYEVAGELIEEEKELTTAAAKDFVTLDVSPVHFIEKERKLIGYSICAGARKADYVIDYSAKYNVHSFLFLNSFGCQEVFSCLGLIQTENKIEREHGYSDGIYLTTSQKEERTYKAETGEMSQYLAVTAEDFIRSKEVYLLRGSLPYKAVTLIGSEIKDSNSLDNSFNYIVEYRLSQRNHNVLDLRQEGRIFDHTFDHSFN